MIFDTDVLIRFFRGDKAAARLLDAERARAISIVTFMELMQGAESRAEVAVIRRFLREQGFALVPIDEAISYLAASLAEEHARASGLRVADALIAATARERGEILATGNARHFRSIAGLELKVFRPAQSRPD